MLKSIDMINTPDKIHDYKQLHDHKTCFCVNSSDFEIPIAGIEIKKEIIIMVDGKYGKFTDDCYDSIVSVLGAQGCRRFKPRTKFDIFGTLKLFAEYIVPAVFEYININGIDISGGYLSDEACYYIHCVSSLNILKTHAFKHNYSINMAFNVVTEKIISETFSSGDVVLMSSVFTNFDVPFDTKTYNISLVMTRLIDNINDKYIQAESMYMFPECLTGRLADILIYGEHPLRPKKDIQLIDDLSDTSSEEIDSPEDLFED